MAFNQNFSMHLGFPVQSKHPNMARFMSPTVPTQNSLTHNFAFTQPPPPIGQPSFTSSQPLPPPMFQLPSQFDNIRNFDNFPPPGAPPYVGAPSFGIDQPHCSLGLSTIPCSMPMAFNNNSNSQNVSPLLPNNIHRVEMRAQSHHISPSVQPLHPYTMPLAQPSSSSLPEHYHMAIQSSKSNPQSSFLPIPAKTLPPKPVPPPPVPKPMQRTITKGILPNFGQNETQSIPNFVDLYTPEDDLHSQIYDKKQFSPPPPPIFPEPEQKPNKVLPAWLRAELERLEKEKQKEKEKQSIDGSEISEQYNAEKDVDGNLSPCYSKEDFNELVSFFLIKLN